jgi:hypothetical protein
LPQQNRTEQLVGGTTTLANIFQCLNHAFGRAVGLGVTGRADTVFNLTLSQEIRKFLSTKSRTAIGREHPWITCLQKYLPTTLQQRGRGWSGDAKIKRKVAEAIDKRQVGFPAVLEKISRKLFAGGRGYWGGQKRLGWGSRARQGTVFTSSHVARDISGNTRPVEQVASALHHELNAGVSTMEEGQRLALQRPWDAHP